MQKKKKTPAFPKHKIWTLKEAWTYSHKIMSRIINLGAIVTKFELVIGKTLCCSLIYIFSPYLHMHKNK